MVGWSQRVDLGHTAEKKSDRPDEDVSHGKNGKSLFFGVTVICLIPTLLSLAMWSG